MVFANPLKTGKRNTKLNSISLFDFEKRIPIQITSSPFVISRLPSKFLLLWQDTSRKVMEMQAQLTNHMQDAMNILKCLGYIRRLPFVTPRLILFLKKLLNIYIFFISEHSALIIKILKKTPEVKRNWIYLEETRQLLK